MKVTAITAMTVKVDRPYRLSGQSSATPLLPGGSYFHFPPYTELYGRCTEALLVRVETDAGIIGWGEAQAPIGPEVAQAIVANVLAPVVLGQDPLRPTVRYEEMYNSMRARGQTSGYQLDAIAAIDTALWDIAGKAHGAPISELLGGRFRTTLTCYVTGLLGATKDERLDEAKGWRDLGIAGVKPLLGFGVEDDAREVAGLRESLGPDARLFADVLWRYDQPSAQRLGRLLQEVRADFLESPIAPEDIGGHAALASALEIAVAVGEPLRTVHQFLPWLRARAMDVCQPDLMRNGVSETVRIAALANAFNIPVALHNGAVTVVGMSATWQVASTLPNFYIQELEPQMLELFNPWLRTPLSLRDGEAVVPDLPGLGLEIDESRLHRDVSGAVTVGL